MTSQPKTDHSISRRYFLGATLAGTLVLAGCSGNNASVSPAAVVPTPPQQPSDTTKWTTSIDSNGVAHLQLSVNGASATDFLIRGVAYSPAPIGSSNKDGPTFGDLFWDSPGNFLDYERIWQRDIEQIRTLGINAVRTYSLIANVINNDGTYPSPADVNASGSLLVHQHLKFLDAAWNGGKNPIYVIVGIPMPTTNFIKAESEVAENAAMITFWNNNFNATVTQMKDHPAVIGFTMFNEVGGRSDFSDVEANAQFYWSQVQKYANLAKSLAPAKLIGWAFNDDPYFASSTVAYREQYAKSIDFYGVNAFQKAQLGTTLDPWKQAVQSDATRPVILTEYGLPATSHRDPNDPLTIYADDTTIGTTATAVQNVIPQAFSHPVVTGIFYFEWSDEWWKQANGLKDRQEGGNADGGFPNGYADEEGYGLNSIALGDRLASQTYTDNLGGKGANVQVDILTPRTALLNAVTQAFNDAVQTRQKALSVT